MTTAKAEDSGVAQERSTARTEASASKQIPPEIIEESLRRYTSNLGELRRGVVGVALPLGSVEAIERLSRDLIAFGFGMGESQSRICDQLEWYEKATAAQDKLMANVKALKDANHALILARNYWRTEALGRVVTTEREPQ